MKTLNVSDGDSATPRRAIRVFVVVRRKIRNRFAVKGLLKGRWWWTQAVPSAVILLSYEGNFSVRSEYYFLAYSMLILIFDRTQACDVDVGSGLRRTVCSTLISKFEI